MINKIQKHLRKQLRNFRLFSEFIRDGFRFSKYGIIESENDSESIRSQLLKLIHSLEKGLIMPMEPRVFGSDKMIKIKKLLANLPDRSENEWIPQYANDVIGHVIAKNEAIKTGVSLPEIEHGVISFERDYVISTLPPSPENFFNSRKSLREYSTEPVEPTLLARAVQLAQRCPSVCNRQSGRVRFYISENDKLRILRHQGGNAGFGHLAPVVAIISSDLRAFHHTGERNQAFVDGGLFAMSLAIAFHTLGMGACMLNWGVTSTKDRALRKEAQIPNHETIIMLMSIGHLALKFKAAESRKRPLSEVWLNQKYI